MGGVEKEGWEYKIGKKTFLYIPPPKITFYHNSKMMQVEIKPDELTNLA